METFSQAEQLWIGLVLIAVIVRIVNFSDTITSYRFSQKTDVIENPLRAYAKAGKIIAIDDIRREVNRLLILISFAIVGIFSAYTPPAQVQEVSVLGILVASSYIFAAIIITLDGVVDTIVRRLLMKALPERKA